MGRKGGESLGDGDGRGSGSSCVPCHRQCFPFLRPKTGTREQPRPLMQSQGETKLVLAVQPERRHIRRRIIASSFPRQRPP